MRNLDMTALRSFVTVADTGGVTRAAGVLNLTQSAVSMQLKRLEDSLNLSLLDRSARTISLTPSGEQMLGYARKILNANDEAISRLTDQEYRGEIRLGVPHDIIYPTVPLILRRFAAEFPQMQVKLISAPTRQLLEMFNRGEVEVILTTEERAGAGGEEMAESDLVWIGAIDGAAWKRDPLPIAFCTNCIFRQGVLDALDKADMNWTMAVNSELDNAVEAAVSADLAIHVSLKGTLPAHTEEIQHSGALPPLKSQRIIRYVQNAQDPVTAALADIIQRSYAASAAPALPKVVMA